MTYRQTRPDVIATELQRIGIGSGALEMTSAVLNGMPMKDRKAVLAALADGRCRLHVDLNVGIDWRLTAWLKKADGQQLMVASCQAQ